MLFSSEISARPSPRVLSLCVKRFSLIPSQERTDIGTLAASKRADSTNILLFLLSLFFIHFFFFLLPFRRARRARVDRIVQKSHKIEFKIEERKEK